MSTPEGAAPIPGAASTDPADLPTVVGHDARHKTAPDELKQAFLRLSPQGSLRWNFAGAFAELEKRYAPGPSGPTTAAGLVLPQPPPRATKEVDAPSGKRDLLDKVVNRYLVPRLQSWVDRRASFAALQSVLPEVDLQMAEADQGLQVTVEALRFLAARIQELEDAHLATVHPVDALAWLIGPINVTPVAGVVTRAVALHADTAPQGAPVLVGECGSGDLVRSLLDAGVSTTGIEPRGSLALEAEEGGLPIHMGEISTFLAEAAPSSLGGVVLAGVVDRLALADNIALLALAVDRLGSGAPLVVIGDDPRRVAEAWGVVAQDLLPGRPLHAETWSLLLSRHGLEQVALLTSAAGSPLEGGPEAAFAVVGTKPGATR